MQAIRMDQFKERVAFRRLSGRSVTEDESKPSSDATTVNAILDSL